MRRVVLAGGAVAIGGGSFLGSAIALGGPVLTVLAAALCVVGTLRVVLMTPPPRAPARPATITLGVPLREASAEDAEATTPEGDPLPYPSAGTTGTSTAVGRPAPVAA